jgi:hypothetical protein
MEGDSDSISKIDLVSVADARGPSAFFIFIVDCFFVGGFVPAALSKSCLRGSQPSVSCSCPGAGRRIHGRFARDGNQTTRSTQR